MTTPTVLVLGPTGEVGDLIASLLEPYRIDVLRADNSEEALSIVKVAERVDLVILLPDASMDADDFQHSVRDVSPRTRMMKLDRYVASSSGNETSVETSALSLDPSELLELIEAALRSAGSAQRSGFAADEKRDLAVRIVLGLTDVIETMTFLNGGNTKSIMEDAIRVGQELGLSQQMLDEISMAALLQDVGMARLKRSSDGGMVDVETHCVKSAEIAHAMRLPWRVKPIIMAHHERYDGLGYPRGLASRQIPVGARILNVVTSFYAMLSGGPGQEPLSRVDALEQLIELSGRQFDPEIVEIYLGLVHGRDYAESIERRIALVAVDDMTRGSLSLRLVRSGYDVWFLASDADSVQALAEHPASGAVVGVSSTETSGMEFLHWLRADARLNELPTIALVAREDGLTGAQAALELGADDALVHPIKPRELVNRVGGLIRRRRRRQEGDTVSLHHGESMRSRLDQSPLPELCQMLRDGRKTARVSVRSGGKKGTFAFESGTLVDAEMNGHDGDDAFLELLGLTTGQLAVAHGIGTPKRTVTKSLDSLLMEALVSDDSETPTSVIRL